MVSYIPMVILAVFLRGCLPDQWQSSHQPSRGVAKSRYIPPLTTLRMEELAMPTTGARRLVKRCLDSTLVPLFQYSSNPIVAKFVSQFDQATTAFVSQFAQISNEFLSQFQRATGNINSPTAYGAQERLRDSQTSLRQEIAELRKGMQATMPDNPCIAGFKVYAQTDEDGIVEYILDRLTNHSRTFIEIGCGRGVENNTHYLLLKGYRGCWVDGSSENIAFIKDGLGALDFAKLIVRERFVSTENIGAIITELCAFVGTAEPAFFSLDIDGNDLHVLAEALKYFKPLLICVEYNAKFPPPFAITTRYEPNQKWVGDDYHGASLQAFCDLLVDYKLVACNLSGVNAFFVRRDHGASFADYTPGQLYQPFRENLIDLRSEHQPSLKWLRDKLC